MPASKSDPELELPQVDAQLWFDAISAWIEAHWLQIAIACGIGAAIYLILNAGRSFGKRLRAKPGESIGFVEIFARASARTNQFFMVMIAARLVSGYTSPPQLMAQTIVFFFTVATVFQVAIWAREVILALVERRTQDVEHGAGVENAMGIIRLLVTVTLFAIALIVVLDNLGVNVSGLIAGLGIGGIAIGLAAQGIFSDLFAALAIIFDKPFRKGETIQYDNTTGTVQRIGLKTTRLRASTGERKIISNADLLKKEITNSTLVAYKRIKFLLSVIYQTEPAKLEQVPQILHEIVEDSGARFQRAAFVNFAPSSLDFEVEFDIMKPVGTSVDDIRQKVGLAIVRRFAEEGISFAYPTQTSFTAAPNGQPIMPYPEEYAPALPPANKTRRKDGGIT